MLDDHRASAAAAVSSPIDDDDEDDEATEVREIHALTSTSPLQQHHPSSSSSSSSSSGRARRRDQSWELTSYRSPNLSLGSEAENFTTMSREFNAMVVAGTTMQDPTDTTPSGAGTDTATNLGRIGEDELLEETNPLAIVPDSNPIPSPRRASSIGGPLAVSASSSVDNSTSTGSGMAEVSVHQVKKEEVESKIGAWQTAEIAKINNRFKREDVVINGWESEQVEKAAARLKKVERKLDEQRARALEKMQNDVAKARRKAEEKRASAEAKRGTKVAKVLELSNLLRAVGRAPSKRSFF